MFLVHLGTRNVAKTAGRCFITTDGYLHKTIVPTFHFQASLPKLPIPKLEASLQRYIDSATPLVSEADLTQTKKVVQEFQDTVGPKLHQELKAKDNAVYSSFISQYWFDMYLRNRSSLPLNVNPQMTFLDDPVPEKNNQAVRAASIIHASGSFFRTLTEEQLEPDLFHMKPAKTDNDSFKRRISFVPEYFAWFTGFVQQVYALDMSQYSRLFHSTRIPQLHEDKLQSYPKARHVVVQRGADFFTFDLLNQDGFVVSRDVIEKNIKSILALPLSKTNPLGLLTTMQRDDWAKARENLISRPLNAASLEAVDSALFAVCLEDASPSTMHDISLSMLYGSGNNRWFDKSFQLIVNGAGKAAVNFEHAWGDGVAVLRWFNEVFKESVAHTLLSPNTSTVSTVKKLEWDLSTETVNTIQKAAVDFETMAKSVELKICETRALDSTFIRQHGFAPDGVMQMAMQLAHYRMHGYSAATYESAATAAFKHGRTETIRSATVQSDAFCKAMISTGVPAIQRKALFKAAVEKHSALTKDALTGKGWDRHLFALKTLAAEQNLKPDIFADKSYGVLQNIILSTSTLSSPALDGGGFGPVGPDCYGIGYGVRDIGARFCVMSYHRQTSEFVKALADSVFDIRCTILGIELGSVGAQKLRNETQWDLFH